MRNIAKVSVCIPVYGVEKYIEKCARTLFEQTLQEIEYIFVDDCTPDRSIEILQNVLEDYPHRKEQVKIIHHEKNGGLVAARNTALKHVSGEYVIHCDSDDWVELDMYETMYNKAKETDADMVYCSFVWEISQEKQIISSPHVIDDPSEFIEQMYACCRSVGVWDKLYKRDIALHKNIKCPKEIVMYEDLLRNTLMLQVCKKISCTMQAFYHYRFNQTSICNKNKNTEKRLFNIEMIKKIFLIIENECHGSSKFISKRKCIELLFCIQQGGMAPYYKEIFPEVQKEILKTNIRIDIKIILLIAKYSYRIAFCFEHVRLLMQKGINIFRKNRIG